MEMDESGMSIYCMMAFISLVVIMFIMLNLFSIFAVPPDTPINTGALANDILLISIMIIVLIAIFYLYRKSKKSL